MNTSTILVMFAGALAVSTLSGCASPKDSATFVTKTSFSLVDVDTTPASVSIAYDRIEGYVGPRFDDGSVYPVAGALETRGKGFSREIRQVYATGDAARIVTMKTPASNESRTTPATLQPGPGGAAPRSSDNSVSAPKATESDNKVMFFATGTTVGVKIGFTEGTVVPTSFTLGYKRKEVSVIPVDKIRQPSVLATFDNTAGVDAPPTSGNSALNFDVEQFFATGVAAVNLAGNDAIRARFQDSAVKAVGEVEKYRGEEARQGRLALDTLNCFARIADDRLDRVWNNAEDLGVFGDLGTVDRLRRDPTRKQQRERYIGDLGLLNPNSGTHSVALGFHKKAVCDLGKSSP